MNTMCQFAVFGLGGGEIILIIVGLLIPAAVVVGIILLVRYLTKAQSTPPPIPPPQNTKRFCPQCGVEMPTNAPQGLCPTCLMKVGLGSQFGDAPPESATALPPEEIAKFFPQLEIICLLGHGGMGMVYKARQPQLDRFVALKILSPHLSKDPAFAERFSREAKALARLNHPNIVGVFDFGKAGDFYYFLMEYMDGMNLSQLQQTKKQLPPEEALAIVPKICDALQYAHDEGVVHRDIKPANILIDQKGRVKIADFGIAKMVGKAGDFSLTQSRSMIGTPQYMAPEQIEKPLDVDHRADIYALGVVFYEMLTGELPMGRFAPPSQKVQVDVRLDEVVLRALEKEPSRRYQQASQVKSAVETVAAPQAQAGRHSQKLRIGGYFIAASIIATGIIGGAWLSKQKRLAREAAANESIVAEYDWNSVKADGKLLGGIPVEIDGRIALKIENTNNTPLQVPILRMNEPPLSSTNYWLFGEVKYESVQGAGYLEMWNHFRPSEPGFPPGEYFSRTLDHSGPLGRLTGSSNWRPFSLPFFSNEKSGVPTRLEFNVFLPGKGIVYISPVKLMERTSGAIKTGSRNQEPTDGVSAAKILERVSEKYSSLETFTCSGRVVAAMDDTPDMGATRLTTDFDLKLSRPMGYRIEWSQPVQASQYTNCGAIWSAGDRHFRFSNKKTNEVPDAKTSFGVAAGISGGITASLPPLFFETNHWLSNLKNSVRQRDELVDGQFCFVVRGGPGDKKVVLWISKETYLLKQRLFSFDGAGAAAKIGANGKSAIPEDLRNRLAQTTGTVTEIYDNVVINTPIQPTELQR
jgi:serine/threonine protein kinase